MNKDLENQFHEGMINIYDRARDEAHYTDNQHFRKLFTAEEQHIVKNRLIEYGYII